MKRTIIIGDVHGCIAELHELLALVQFHAGEDTLVFLGDYLDRGPDSVGALRLVRDLTERNKNAVALIGNHDEKHLRYAKRPCPLPPGATPMRFAQEQIAINRQLSPDDIEFLASLPFYFKGGGFLAVHAGISPIKHNSLEDLMRNRERRDLLLRIRKVDSQGNALKLGEPPPPPPPPGGGGGRPGWALTKLFRVLDRSILSLRPEGAWWRVLLCGKSRC
jgi:hypothetical protein